MKWSGGFSGMVAVGLLFLCPTAAVAQTQPACAPVTKDQIVALSDKWDKALTAGQVDEITALYADEAVLLPLMSTEPRKGRPAIRSYFEQYIKRHPQGGVNTRSIMVGCNTASDIGTYVYRLTGRRKGTREAVGGRYTTVYEFRGGQWLIVQQQASMAPDAVKPAPVSTKPR